MDLKNPVMGQFVFDGTEFLVYAVDLPPGACKGMLVTREGFEEVCKEMIANQTEWGGKAGIPDQEISELALTDERIARIDVFLPPLAKVVEVLTETRYMLDDKRQRIILDAAQAVDRRSGKLPELKAKYEKTRVYRSVIAKKGLKTREQNAIEQSAAAKTNEAGGAPQQSAAPATP
jgi:hypothetical protein